MKKYYRIQIKEKPGIGLAGKNLDIRFYVPDGLTVKQIKELEAKIGESISDYGSKHEDYADMDYHRILERAMKKLAVKFEYPKVDYTMQI